MRIKGLIVLISCTLAVSACSSPDLGWSRTATASATQALVELSPIQSVTDTPLTITALRDFPGGRFLFVQVLEKISGRGPVGVDSPGFYIDFPTYAYDPDNEELSSGDVLAPDEVGFLGLGTIANGRLEVAPRPG